MSGFSHVKSAPPREAAEALAIEALSYLAAEPRRLEGFLALSGLGAHEVRGAAREPGFLAGVLEHVCGDERLLLAFAAEAGVPPERIAKARLSLTGPDPHWP